MKHEALDVKESTRVLKRNSEDLEDDQKKGRQKNKTLIRRCIKP